MVQQPVLYDFISALDKLQDKIQTLSEAKQQATGVPPTRLGVAWSFLKANRGNVLLLITFYSMSTAGVIGSAMARHRLQSDRLLEGKEQEQLQRHIHRLEQQVQQQQQLLDGLAADLQQHSSSSSSSGWRAAGVRQQMMQRLQRWKAGGQAGASEGAGSSGVGTDSSSSSRGDEQAPRQQEPLGAKVGHLGRGFLI